MTVYKDEPDSICHERMGVTENFGEEGEENGADTAKFVNRTELERQMAELQASVKESVKELEAGKRGEAGAKEEAIEPAKKKTKKNKSDEDELAALQERRGRARRAVRKCSRADK